MQQRLRRPSQRQSTPRRPLPQQQPAPWWHHFSLLIGTLRLRFSAWPDIRLGLFLPNAGLEAGTFLCVWADVVSLRHPTDRHQQWFYRVGDYSPASVCRLMPIFAKTSRARSRASGSGSGNLHARPLGVCCTNPRHADRGSLYGLLTALTAAPDDGHSAIVCIDRAVCRQPELRR
jgi:hypothetical protein